MKSIRVHRIATLFALTLVHCAGGNTGDGDSTTRPKCGDGHVSAGETCDDGITVIEACAYGETQCSVCNTECEQVAGSVSYCGDNVIDSGSGEDCDDGNAETESCDYDAASCEVCGSACGLTAGGLQFCGDGVLNTTHEECDAGNTIDDECALGDIGCTICDASCALVPGLPNSANSAPTVSVDQPASTGMLPGASKTLTATAVDVDSDVLTLDWAVFSATVDGVACDAEVSVDTSAADGSLTLTLPLAHTDVRCADELRVEVSVTDGDLSDTDFLVLSAEAPLNLGDVWTPRPSNPIMEPSTCPTWECLAHGDPSIARDDSGVLNVWFSSAGDRGGPVIGRAVELSNGSYMLAPNAPVMEPDVAGVPPDPIPWDYHRETVSVMRAPTASRWNMLYLGYATDYFTDPAIGLTQSSDSAGTVWPRPAQPIYTPTRPGGWDAGFLTSPHGLEAPDGTLRIYFSGASFIIDGVGKVGVLISTDDGATWTAHTGNPIFEGRQGSWDESVIDAKVSFVGGRYLMWYSAFVNPLSTHPIGIGLATSEDGYSWT